MSEGIEKSVGWSQFYVEVAPAEEDAAAEIVSKVWDVVGDSTGAFRLTHASVGRSRRPAPSSAEMPGAVRDVPVAAFVCDYIARGANRHDAQRRIGRVVRDVKILWVYACTLATIIDIERLAWPLPGHEELRKRWRPAAPRRWKIGEDEDLDLDPSSGG